MTSDISRSASELVSLYQLLQHLEETNYRAIPTDFVKKIRKRIQTLLSELDKML